MRDIRRLFLLTLLISPLLFGTVEVWSISLIEVSILVVFFLWLRKRTCGYSHQGLTVGEVRYLDVTLLYSLILLLVLCIFQILPLPLDIIKALSPHAYEIYAASIDNTCHTLSLYPYASFLEIMRFISYIIAFFLTIQLFSREEELLSLVKSLMIIGTLIALIGIFQMIFWNGKLLWVRELRNGGTPFGPYVNRNHFAGLMEMLIPVSTGMLILFFPPFSLKKGLRHGLSEFMRHERANIFILSLTSVIIMITSLFLSLSRGGITGFSSSMIFFGIMLSLRNSTRKKGVLIVLMSAIILLTVGWFGWDKIIDRFEKLKEADVSSEMRLHNWQDSIRIIRDFPFTGTGLGTYEHIYPRYKTISSQERWEHSHNDYVEGAVEMGIAGLAIAAYIVFRFYRLILSGLMKRRLLEARLLSLGALTGVTGILVHSITDFNLHIGANGLYFSVLMGMALSAININPLNEGGTMLQEKRMSKRALLLAYGLIIILTILISLITVADIYYLSLSGPLRDDKESLIRKKGMLEVLMRLSPLDSRFPFSIGNISSMLAMDDEALRYYKRAVRFNPLNGEYLQMLGLAFDRKGDERKSEKSFALSIKNDPTSAWIRKNYALWLFSKGKKEEAIIEMRKAMSLDPSKTRQYVTGLILAGVTPDQVRDVVPDNSLSQLLYGRFREERGELDNALDAYANALSIMKREGIIRTEIYLRIGAIYEKKGMLKEALSVYDEGVRQRPDDPNLRLGLARLYERLQVPYRAIQEYERVLVINPANQYAQQRLKRLRKE